MSARLLLLALALGFASANALPGRDGAPRSTPGATSPAFTLADVQPSPAINYPYMHGGTLHGDRYSIRQATMVDLISNAYSLDPTIIQGGPSWLELDRFDIVAEAPNRTPATTLRLMLRSLLVSRFGLITHSGTALMPAWVLTTVKPKLEEAPPGARTECAPTRPSEVKVSMVAVACHNMPMDQFARILQSFGGSYLDNKPVVDDTGLRGNYDFEFQWTPRGYLGSEGSDGISIFDAVEKQLGLKLDLRTAPHPALIVDRVNRTPTPNAPGIEKALPPEPPPQFEVAVIKPSKPDEQPGGDVGTDRIDFRSYSLKYLIQFAWNLDLNDDEDVAGLPKRSASDRYDIMAKAAPEDVAQIVHGSRQIEYEVARQMLRTLLIERFGIQAHMEERPVAAYNFERAGPRLKAANPSERTKCEKGPGPGERDPRSTSPALNSVFHCQNITLTEFGRQLPFLAYGYIYSPVLDDTDLQGRYDFTLSFSSAGRVEPGAGGGRGKASGGEESALAPADPNGAMSLYEAVHRQLGLRLKKVRRPVPILVIDHINRQPSAN